jgi:hypothetical protein
VKNVSNNKKIRIASCQVALNIAREEFAEMNDGGTGGLPCSTVYIFGLQSPFEKHKSINSHFLNMLHSFVLAVKKSLEQCSKTVQSQ